MTVPMPNPVHMYRSRLEGFLAERQSIERKLAQAIGAGEPAEKLAEQARQTDADIERARITLGLAERAEAEQKQQAADKAAQRDRKTLDKACAAVDAAALAFEAALLGAPVEAWKAYAAAQDAAIAEHRRLGFPLPDGGFHRPAKVWANVLSRFLRAVGLQSVEALRPSATPQTLTDLFGQQRRH